MVQDRISIEAKLRKRRVRSKRWKLNIKKRKNEKLHQIGKIELERKGNELELAINWGFWWWKWQG